MLQDSLVASVSELILEGMGDELFKYIKEQRLTGLWIRVVLVKRMMECGVKMPLWLKNTLAPDRIAHYGYVLMPHSQKVEPSHPIFDSLISTLAACHELSLGKKAASAALSLAYDQKPSPVAILFKEMIAPAISYCFGHRRKEKSLQIAYKLLNVGTNYLKMFTFEA